MTDGPHRLLARQLRRHFAAGVPESLRPFLADVDRAFHEADDDRRLLERSLDLASQELLKRQEELMLAFTAAHIAAWTLDFEGDAATWHVLRGEGPPERRSGRASEFFERIVPEDRDRVRGELKRAFEQGAELRVEFRACDAGQPVRWWAARGRRTRQGGGRLMGVCVDITAQVTMREAEARRLAMREKQSRSLTNLALLLAQFDHGDIRPALWQTTHEIGRVLGADRVGIWELRGERLCCLDELDLRSKAHSSGKELVRCRSLSDLAALDDHRAASSVVESGGTRVCRLAAAIRRGGRLVGMIRCEQIDAPRAWTPEEEGFAASAADLVSLLLEMAARRRAEAELEHQRAFLRQVIDVNPSYIFAKDAEGRYTLANEAAASLYGVTADELVGKTDADFNVDAERLRRIRSIDEEVIVTKSERAFEDRWTDAFGRTHWVHMVKRPIAGRDGAIQVLGVAVDVSQQKEAEDERLRLEGALRQAQKLEAIGMLAGGVAHDFNNLLTPILSNAEHGIEVCNGDEALRQLLVEIREAAERARDLTTQLLAFGRKQVLDLRSVDVNEEVRSTAKLIARTLPESIECKLDLDPKVSLVRADRTQIHQAILNLVINARDAMADGGVLVISTRAERSPNGEGSESVIRVRDTGVGMDEATLSQIFQPFFTTKGVGRGTGLGLATVYGIVRQHGGVITATSRPGEGSTFEIRLPASPDESSNLQPSSVPAPRSGGETILVVEDDLHVRRVVERVLRRRGYRILMASDPEDAIALARSHAFDLLLTDVILPKMNGRELHETLSGSCQDVVFMSGHSHDVLAPKGILEGKFHCLRKPFTPRQLERAIREALGYQD
jgi:PAS domain S-box-containing protein